jgi:S-DNA-T family DNA segregation ATPase FtsK/SpoIIIE
VTATLQSERLELRLLAGAPGRPPVPVALEAPADAGIDAVAEALAHALGAEHGELVRARDGRQLSGSLAQAGLRHGDLVLLGPSRARPRDAATELELVVVGGPASGRRFTLPPGEHVVGRDVGAAIVLDDPALSGRHLQLTVRDGGVTVTDLGSRNGTLLHGEALEPGGPEPLAADSVVHAGRSLLLVGAPPADTPAVTAAADGTVPFNRPPRVQRPLEPARRPFPPPPDSPQRGRLPLGASLIPLALGIGLYLVTHLPTMLFFSTLAPVMALSTYMEDRRSGRKGYERRRREYRKRLAALRDELEAERSRELSARRAALPSAAHLLRRARTLDPALWERSAGDPDFLALRLGSADLPSLLEVAVERGGNPELRGEADEVASWYATAPDVPVALPLAELGTVGLCGPQDGVEALARWLVAQAVTLHSPRELVLAAALDEEEAARWTWLQLLPHARPEGSPLPRTLVAGPLAARALVDELARIAAERRDAAGEAFGAGRRAGWPTVLGLLDERVAPERPLVAEALADAAEAGIAVLWLGSERRDLPGECAGIVELDHASARLAYTDARSGETLDDVSADFLPLELAEELAQSLAPVRDTSATRGGGIPDRVSLFELEGVHEPRVHWDEREGLSATIGAAAGGPFRVDLRADGPHALVAGMTGAGKSELLQTLIASLAAANPPTRLTFLLVDYKGGAAFKECADLPHTVGVVTDLDAHLTQRALVSLNAELQRRERLLRDAGAKDLADMERRAPELAPPSLAIVIDEFATLAKEVPDFIDGVVDVAQRGRSLGVHLVLATQRPGGVVSENIRANTNLRIALRVNEAAESTDVIGVPDAARIPRDRPGRSYARTGHGELTELQTAYVGGASRSASRDREVRVHALRFETTLAPAGDRPGEEGETNLQRLVSAARAEAERRRLPRPRSPWLPPLPSVLDADSLAAPGETARVAVLGLLDEPGRQLQEALVLDLEHEGSALVYGASGSGKTTFLRTLALSLVRHASADEVHLYGLDFATRGLAALADLPHTGAVISGEDEERTARLFGLLRATLERRKQLFAEQGVFTLSEYVRAGGEPLARVVVLLDGYAGFASAFERVNLGELVDALPRLVGDGRPLGVHFVITADRRGAVPNALAGIIPTKLALRLADEDEFQALGIPLRAVRGAHLPPGRGFRPDGTEFQVAIAGGDPSGTGQAAALAEVAQSLRAQHGSRRAPAVEPLPTQVSRGELPRPSEALHAVVGLGDAELAPVELAFEDRHFLVLGPYRSGRSTALATIALSLRAADPALELHLLAPRRSPLGQLPIWATKTEGVDASDAVAVRLAEEVDTRRCVVVIDDGEELAESVGAPSLEILVRRGRDHDVRVVAACERQAAQRAFSGWVRELRKEQNALLLDPDPEVDGDLVGVRLPRRSSPVWPAGRGYLVRRGEVELVQVAR